MARKHIATQEEIRAFTEFVFETSPVVVHTSLVAILRAEARKHDSLQRGVLNAEMVALLRFLNRLALIELEGG